MDDCSKYIARRTKENGLEADADYCTNLRTAYVLHRVTLRMDNDLPCFQSPAWMIENLSADELTVLLGLYQECVRLSGPIEPDIDASKAEGIAAVLAHSKPDDALTELAKLAPAQLSLLAVLLSVKIDVLKSELATLRS